MQKRSKSRAQMSLWMIVGVVLALVGSIFVPQAVQTAEAQAAFACNVNNNRITWTNQGVSDYQVRQIVDGDETFLSAVSGVTSFNLPGFAEAYRIRYRDGANLVDSSICSGNPLPAFTCSLFNDAGQEYVVWTDQQQSTYTVRQIVDGDVGTIGTTGSRFFPVSGFAEEYSVRTRINQNLVEATCAGNGQPVFNCSVRNGVISWDDFGADSYQVRQIVDGTESFLAAVDNGDTSFVLPGFADAYAVRFNADLSQVRADCSGNPLPAFNCSLFNQAGQEYVVWSDQRSTNYTVRQVVGGATTTLGSTSDRFFPVTGLAPTYTVTTRVNQNQVTASCAGTPPPTFTCSVANGALTWVDQGVDAYHLRKVIDGVDTFLANVDGTQTSFALPGFADAYIVRYNGDAEQILTTCTGNPLPAFTCSLFLQAGQEYVVWTDQQAATYTVRSVDGDVITTLGATGDRFFPVTGIAQNYTVTTRVNGSAVVATCAGNPPPAFTCSVANNTISWTDQGVDSYQVRTLIDGQDSFLAVVNGVTSFDLPTFADDYIVRYNNDVGQVLATCSGNPLPAFTCSLFNQAGQDFVVWTDQQQANYTVRHVISNIPALLGSTANRFFAVDGLADSYVVRTRVNGDLISTTCAGNPPPPFACSVSGNVLSWTDQSSDSYTIREINGGTETFTASVGDVTSFTIDGPLADRYVVRHRNGNGTLVVTNCPA